MQKYYHRGAFFMDEEEDLYKRNVDQPTLEDHYDKVINFILFFSSAMRGQINQQPGQQSVASVHHRSPNFDPLFRLGPPGGAAEGHASEEVWFCRAHKVHAPQGPGYHCGSCGASSSGVPCL